MKEIQLQMKKQKIQFMMALVICLIMKQNAFLKELGKWDKNYVELKLFLMEMYMKEHIKKINFMEKDYYIM